MAALFILTFVGLAAAQTKGSNGVNLHFLNRSNYPATIFWLNAGKEKLYKTLDAQQAFVQPTFAKHQWRVRMNGKLVGTYAATAAPDQEIEIIVATDESPMRIQNQKDAEKHCKATFGSIADDAKRYVWIGKWGSLGEGQMSFCEFASLRSSIPSEVVLKKVSVNFVNKTKTPVRFSWVEDGGGEKLYGTVDAGGTLKQDTFATHKWRVKLTDGKSIGEYAATDQDSQKIEVVYDMREVKQIRNQKEAEQECGKAAAAKGGVWTGNWSELGDAKAPFCQVVRLQIGR